MFDLTEVTYLLESRARAPNEACGRSPKHASVFLVEASWSDFVTL